jgi:predicted RNA-binding Zn-ribbon protein involved in translation (DUF1610 family)
MHWLDQKYASLVATSLERFVVKKNDPYLANFRCPICGDSQKNKRKARGYFYTEEQRVKFKCQNCGAAMRLFSFLKQVDAPLAQQYALESMQEKRLNDPRPAPKPDITVFAKPKFISQSVLKDLKKISQLSPAHPAKRYVVGRKIPNVWHSRLFYTDEFKKFTNSVLPDKFPDVTRDEGRLIIPLIARDRSLMGYQGRSLEKDAKIRYITVMLDKAHEKVFNVDQIDFTRPVYVLEGPIDAMFLPNAVAMAGADIAINRVSPNLNNDNAIFVYDNEPRNKEIVARIEKVLDSGGQVVVWPNALEQKDINDMILAGMSEDDVIDMIHEHTYRGLQGKLALSSWRKV